MECQLLLARVTAQWNFRNEYSQITIGKKKHVPSVTAKET